MKTVDLRSDTMDVDAEGVDRAVAAIREHLQP